MISVWVLALGYCTDNNNAWLYALDIHISSMNFIYVIMNGISEFSSSMRNQPQPKVLMVHSYLYSTHCFYIKGKPLLTAQVLHLVTFNGILISVLKNILAHFRVVVLKLLTLWTPIFQYLHNAPMQHIATMPPFTRDCVYAMYMVYMEASSDPRSRIWPRSSPNLMGSLLGHFLSANINFIKIWLLVFEQSY